MLLPGLTIDAESDALAWRATKVPGVDWIPIDLATDGSERDVPAEAPRSNRATRPGATVLIRMAPGVGYAPHRHVGDEYVLVLRGGYRDADGTYEQGRYVHYPAGSSHAPVALGDPTRPAAADNPPCILFAVATEGIELLGRDDGE